MQPDETVPQYAPSRGLTIVLVGLMCVIWGSTWVVIRVGLEDLPPLTSAWIRFAVAALAMTAIAPWLARREGGEAPTWLLTLSQGLLNFGLSYGLVYWSEQYLPSGLVSVLWAIFPLQMAVCGHFFLAGERLRGTQALGFVFGFVGMLVLFSTDIRAIGPGAVPVGLLLLLSPTVAAVGTTVVKRYGRGTSSILLNRNGMWVGAAGLFLAAQLLERERSAHFTPQALASIAYLALIGTVVTFGMFFWLMRYARATTLSLIAYVTPVIALTLGALIEHEPVGRDTLLGSGAILVGVALVLRPRRRAAGEA
jgi:drug/metabolite transporter (DMT)-like permease